MERILVTGAVGQIGSELVPTLRGRYGKENVIATGHSKKPTDEMKNDGPFEFLDITKKEELAKVVKKYNIDTVFHLASLLSSASEKNPNLAWEANLLGLKVVLDVAKENNLKVFWPSSIGAFGPTTPKVNTPQTTVMEPSTMYGVTKVAGELLCNYYFNKYGVDVRSVRYPGIITWKTEPSDGTTEYSIAMFYEGIKNGHYKCFLKERTLLPMMYIDDAIKATIDIMNAPKENIKIRTSYNLAAFSFAPEELAAEIKKYIPNLEVTYEPDFHQAIADSWTKSIDDSAARKEWGWKHKYGFEAMTKEIMEKLTEKLK
ncbi:NAD-dependent epimerase/dehydratase family protein [Candidatus Micrarchaeota archaeon]|nr:NAD-dependent epimerase/dehydratase family protein [Candidatus Micrarchaeota archaeon]